MFNARVIAGSFKAPLTPAALRTGSRRPSQLTCRLSAIFTHYDYSVFTSLLQGSCVFFLLLRVFVDLDSIEVRMRGKKKSQLCAYTVDQTQRENLPFLQ